MVNKVIQINESEDYITLGTLLKLVGAIQTGGMAKMYLANYPVKVDNVDENRRGRKLYRGSVVELSDMKIQLE